ncbi:hypothetical protein [Campylobacter sp. 19-13652]|uniref:hypothetical protein n=1 Tax=Campylobacter sp. 19-13652 TaxID=2840180 RepID=UPI001C76885E|nr:hypothetical protein [Campylobacter sp. 19-13652]BCX79251.1 hypothetical protein LBC_07130 [Campylobacter sp. 19-13652]
MTITLQDSPANFVNELKAWLASKGQRAEIIEQDASYPELDVAIAELESGECEVFSDFNEFKRSLGA